MKLLNVITTFVVLTFGINTYAKPVIIPDSEIINSIKSKLASEKTTEDLKITIKSKLGIVTLSGKVNTDNEASKTIEIAESTPGVKDTDATHLTIKQSKHPIADTVITAKVKGSFIREKLLGDRDISVTSIYVETTNGVVYLTGKVDSQAEIDNAIKLAKAINGVKSVDSKLEVNP